MWWLTAEPMQCSQTDIKKIGDNLKWWLAAQTCRRNLEIIQQEHAPTAVAERSINEQRMIHSGS
jgi:hypothetical protein